MMSTKRFQSDFRVDLPEWAVDELDRLPKCIESIDERMRQVIRFSRLNFEKQSGGPFAAGVFERDSGRLLVIGVNRVIPSNMSSAHAEIVALTLAQQTLMRYDLDSDPDASYQLVVNARPCAMCFGAIPWSGIVDLVVGATGQDIERLTGFDEGPIHPEWQDQLKGRGIRVQENLMRDEACQVLDEFGRSDATVYNGRSDRRS